jgi:hypothetical protein
VLLWLRLGSISVVAVCEYRRIHRVESLIPRLQIISLKGGQVSSALHVAILDGTPRTDDRAIIFLSEIRVFIVD